MSAAGSRVGDASALEAGGVGEGESGSGEAGEAGGAPQSMASESDIEGHSSGVIPGRYSFVAPNWTSHPDEDGHSSAELPVQAQVYVLPFLLRTRLHSPLSMRWR